MPLAANNLQNGHLRATSTASDSAKLRNLRLSKTVFSHKIRSDPGGLLQSSGGNSSYYSQAEWASKITASEPCPVPLSIDLAWKFYQNPSTSFAVTLCTYNTNKKKLAGGRHYMPPPLQVDLWPWKYMVSESHVTWATCVPILVFRGLSVLDLGPTYVTHRQTDVRQTDVRRASSLNASALWAGA